MYVVVEAAASFVKMPNFSPIFVPDDKGTHWQALAASVADQGDVGCAESA